MNKVDGLWEDVQAGFYVLDQDGNWWKVLEMNKESVKIVDRRDHPIIIPKKPGHTAVTMMYDPKTLIEQTLDGKEIT